MEKRGFFYSIGITANGPNLVIGILCMRSNEANEIEREASFCFQLGKKRTLHTGADYVRRVLGTPDTKPQHSGVLNHILGH